MNTKNNSDTPHFNIADVIIIIALIAVIAAFALRIYNILGVDDTPQQVRIEFEVASVSEETISLKEKAKLYYSADDSLVGYVEKFSVEDAVQYAYNEEGDLVRAVVPGKKTIKGTIIIDCVETENGFYLGGKILLSEGSTLTLYTTTRETDFTIKKITVLEEENAEEKQPLNNLNPDSTTSTTVPVQK